MDILATIGAVFVLAYSISMVRRILIVVPVLRLMGRLGPGMTEDDKARAIVYLVLVSPSFAFEEIYMFGLAVFLSPHDREDIEEVADLLVTLFNSSDTGGGSDGPTGT